MIARQLPPPRSRSRGILLLVLTLTLGLASRHFSHLLPWWMAKNAGDVLYATMAYWLLGLLLPRLSAPRLALLTLLFCVGIEFLKFVQTPWLVAARHSMAGRLVFGVGFHVSNLVCYALGTLLAWGVALGLRHRDINTRSPH